MKLSEVRRTLITLVLWLAMVITTAAFAVALAALVTGCAAVEYDPTDVDGEAGPASDEPWAKCADVGPCEGWAFCDELGASESPQCGGVPDGSCHQFAWSRGTPCPGGTCDGMGVCRGD